MIMTRPKTKRITSLNRKHAGNKYLFFNCKNIQKAYQLQRRKRDSKLFQGILTPTERNLNNQRLNRSLKEPVRHLSQTEVNNTVYIGQSL